MAALNYLAGRLGVPASSFISDSETAWTRLEADLRLAQGDFAGRRRGVRRSPRRRAEQARASGAPGRLRRGPVPARPGREAIKPASEAVAIFERARSPGRTDERPVLARLGPPPTDNEEEARALLRSMLDTLRASDVPDPLLNVRVLIALGVVEMGAGRSDVAIAYLREADGLAGEFDTRRRATFLHVIATGYRRAGDHEAAIRAGTESLTLFRSAEARIESAGIANHLALAYLENGSRDRAAEMAQRRSGGGRPGRRRSVARPHRGHSGPDRARRRAITPRRPPSPTRRSSCPAGRTTGRRSSTRW